MEPTPAGVEGQRVALVPQDVRPANAVILEKLCPPRIGSARNVWSTMEEKACRRSATVFEPLPHRAAPCRPALSTPRVNALRHAAHQAGGGAGRRLHALGLQRNQRSDGTEEVGEEAHALMGGVVHRAQRLALRRRRQRFLGSSPVLLRRERGEEASLTAGQGALLNSHTPPLRATFFHLRSVPCLRLAETMPRPCVITRQCERGEVWS